MSADGGIGNAGGRLKVFISYSRADVAWADQLVLAIDGMGHEAILDRHNLEAGEDWRERLSSLIRSSDAVIFILTSTSAKSDICRWEVDEAARLGKKRIPVIPKPFEGEVPDSLADLNFIFFYFNPDIPGSGFYDGQMRLERALSIDLDWIRLQTKLGEQADTWSNQGKSKDLLIRGIALESALAWLHETPDSSVIEPLVREFINVSHAEETTRQALARSRVYWWFTGAAVMLAITSYLSIVSLLGLEPRTLSLKGRCSNQLSYGRSNLKNVILNLIAE